MQGVLGRGDCTITYEEQLKADFKNFLYVVWKFLGLPDPTPVQYEMADCLQNVGVNRRMIEAFRGVGKSWITSAYVVWRLWINPDLKFLVVSASKSRSDDFSTFTKRLIADFPLLQHLKARDDQRDSMVAFDVNGAKPAHAPSVKSVGIFGQLTGSRANEIIADDIEVANNSATQDMRDKLEKATKEFEAIIVPGGQITFLGTPQSEESIYNKLPDRGYNVTIWTARVPSAAKLPFYKGRLALSIVDKLEKGILKHNDPVDPLRFDDRDLIEREASYGRSGFALQFMLDTSLSDAEKYPLKISDLMVLPLDKDKAPLAVTYGSSPDLQLKDYTNPGFTGDRFYRPFYVDKEWIPYEGRVMSIDPSGRGTDHTGYAVVNQLHGKLYVMSAGGFRGGYEDATLTTLAKIAKDFKVNYIVIESNWGDGMFSKLFTPFLMQYHPCTIEEVRHSIQKEKRIIDTLEPIMNQHRLIFNDEVLKRDLKFFSDDGDTLENFRYSLFYQMTHLTKDRGSLRHDDAIDALAIAVSYWVESMGRNEDEAVKEYSSRKLDQQLEEFVNGILNNTQSTTQGNRWYNI